MMGNLTEKQIESVILQWLNAQPDILAFKVNTVGVYDPVRQCYRKNKNPFVLVGTSDIIGACRGQFFAFEVKTPTAMRQPLPPDQVRFIERVRGKGQARGHFVSCLDHVIDHIELMRLSAKKL